MEWGSSYVYEYANSSEEELSEGELEEGMWLSDSENEDDDLLITASANKMKRAQTGQPPARSLQRTLG